MKRPTLLLTLLLGGSFLTCFGAWPVDADGSPFFVKGVTFTIREDAETPGNQEAALRDVKAMGANTIRTWGTGDDTPALLDAAHRKGLKVLLGLWLEHGRDGAEGDGDMNYLTHTGRMGAQTRHVLGQVARYREHPAVLGWGVGNEVILNIPTEEQKVAYAQYLEDLCQQIRALDPLRPILSVSAFTVSVPYWEKYCPSLDAYGINAYGPAAQAIPGMLKEIGSNKPYLVTEFGPRGTWDSPRDDLGVAQMPTDPEKYEQIATGWENWIEAKRPEGCYGAFVFNYGDDWGPTPFLLDMFVRGKKRVGYWAAREAFSGVKNAELILDVGGMILSPKQVSAGESVRAGIEPLDGADLGEVSFYARHAIGGRDFTNRVFPLEHEAVRGRIFLVQAPKEAGVYEVYAHRVDATGTLHIAQTSLRVVE